MKNSLIEDKRKDKVQREHLPKPQKAHLTDEFVIVAIKWWLCAASIGLQPCDKKLSFGDFYKFYIWLSASVFLIVCLFFCFFKCCIKR